MIYLEVRVPRKGDQSDISRSEGATEGNTGIAAYTALRGCRGCIGRIQMHEKGTLYTVFIIHVQKFI